MLVHGAWHGAWCFSEVVRELESLGHAAAAVNLPCDEVGLTQHDYARLIGPQPDAIVVGHSLAAMTIPHVAARTRVYLAGLLPVADVFVPTFTGPIRDELDRSYWPDADTCAASMYPDCTRQMSDWAFAQLRPQARIAFDPAPFGDGDVVVATLRDSGIDPTWQIETARAHGARVIELDSGHSPFLTQPDELAGLLDTLA